MVVENYIMVQCYKYLVEGKITTDMMVLKPVKKVSFETEVITHSYVYIGIQC